jgi:hypothetical protein
LLSVLSQKLGISVTAEDWLAYIAAVAANPAYTARFQSDLKQPGLRIPITADAKVFKRAADVGRVVVWLHTFGERLTDAKAGRPASPPRLPKEHAPKLPKDGAIPSDAANMPDELWYDDTKRRLHVGTGFVDNVPPAVWHYEVSGKQVLVQWFSYRRKNRERPLIGDLRPPSKLGDIQPAGWLAEYTTELINVLNVLGRLVELEPEQATLLEAVCSGPTISHQEFQAAGALQVPAQWRKKLGASTSLFDNDEE